jgi:hypothetical protein
MNASSEDRLYSPEDLSWVIYVMPKAERAHPSAELVRRALNTVEKLNSTPQLIKDIIISARAHGSWYTKQQIELIFPYMQPPKGKGSYKVLCWDKAPEQPVLPLFKLLPENTEPVVEVKQAAAKPATRSNRRAKKFSFSSKTKEQIWEIIDQRILECASHPVTAKVLYKKARTSGPDRKRFQEYVVPRRDLLLAQGRLHTWKDRFTTYYCVNPHSKPEPTPAVAEAKSIKPPVIVAEIVEPPVKVAAEVVEPPGAIDLYTKKQSRQSAMAGFGDSRPMEEVFSELNIKDLFWAQWQDTKWMTTNEVAAFLRLTPRAIDKNFQRNRDEFIEAGEVQKLESQALRDFREVTDSESVTSKTPALSKYARYINIYTMAGVLRMAWISEGEMGRAVRNATMRLIQSIPAMVKQSADNGRNKQLSTIPTGDLANGVVTEVIEQLMPTVKATFKDAIKESQPFIVQSIDGEFAGIAPSTTRCNEIVEEFGLPPMFTPSGLPNWHCWDGRKPVKLFNPAVYIIFADMQRVGRVRECYSIGITVSNKNGRIGCNHERARCLIQKEIFFKWLWTEIYDTSWEDIEKLKACLENPLQQQFKTIWEIQFDSKKKKQFLDSDPLLNLPEHQQPSIFGDLAV